MKRKERRKKFHQSLLNMLYVPPPPQPRQDEFDEQSLNLAWEISNLDYHRINKEEFEEEERSSSTSGGEEGELGFQKLTRAQRKRLRKKKLKEAASHRRQMIGPQLPTTSDDVANGEGVDATEYQQSQGVRPNASEGPQSTSDHNHGETGCCNKVKQRRMSKRKGREKPKTCSNNQWHEDPSFCDQYGNLPQCKTEKDV